MLEATMSYVAAPDSAHRDPSRGPAEPLVPPALLDNRTVLTAVAVAATFTAMFGSVLYFLSI